MPCICHVCVLFSVSFVRYIYYCSEHLKITLEMCAEMHAGAHAKCPLLLSNFNQNWLSSLIVVNFHYQVSSEQV